MAFQYKNVLESALNKLPSRYSEQILASTCDKIDKKVELANSLFSYAVKPEVSELLTKSGIELAPISFNAHTHPACKMIENYLLFVYIPHLLSNIRSVAFFSLRESKIKNFIEMFQVFNYGEVKNFGMYNCLIDSKDSYRYGSKSFMGFNDRLNGFKEECIKANKFPKILLCHDELHFWSSEDFVTFFETVPEISKIVGTVVFPTEILLGETQSKEPRLYGFEVQGDDLFFFPENEASEGYHQKVSRSRFLFETSFIHIRKGRSIKVSRLKSMFAHHVFSLEVVNCDCYPDVTFYNMPSALLTDELSMIADNFKEAVIERSTFQSICLYLSCLKTPNASSALAKLRQLEKRDLFPDEMSFVHVIAQELSKYGIGAEINAGFFKRMSDSMLIMLPSWLTGDFAGKKMFQLKIRSLLKAVSRQRFEVGRHVYNASKPNYNINIKLPSIIIRRGRNEEKKSPWDPVEASFDVIFKPRSFKNCVNRLRRGWFVHPRNFRHGPRLLCWKVETESISSDSVDDSSGGDSLSLGVDEDLRYRLEELMNLSIPLGTSDQYSSIAGCINPEFIDASTSEVVSAIRMKRYNDCVFKAVSVATGMNMYDLMDELLNSDITEDLFNKIQKDIGLSKHEIAEVLAVKNLEAVCTEDFKSFYRLNPRGGKTIALIIKENHCELSELRLFSRGMSERSEVRFDIDLPDSKVNLNLEHSFALADSMQRGSTGILKSIKPTEVGELAELAKVLRRKQLTINVKYSLGFAGSGKSKKVIDYINLKPTVRRIIISPRTALKDDFSSKVTGTASIVCTHEMALVKIDESFEEIVIDELSLYPAGYMGLLIMCMFRRKMRYASASSIQKSFDEINFDKVKVILIGDPLQARYFSELDCGLIRGETDIDILTRSSKPYNYLFQTYRMGEWFKNVIEIPTVADGSLDSRKFHSDMSTVCIDEFSKILVPDQASKGDFPCSIETMTYTEAEGLTFDKKTLIIVNSSTFKCSVNAIIVAITRSRVGFDFILSGINPREIGYLAKKSILSFIFEKKPIPIDRIKNLLPGSVFTNDEAIGSLESKASKDPFILPFVNITEEIDVEKIEVDDVTESPEWFKTHIPQFDSNPIINEIFEKMADKEKREFRSVGSQSNQFFDLEKGLLKNEVYPMQFSSIFPKHEASDDDTFWAGVRKRMHFSTAIKERKKLDEVRKFGPVMADIFLRHLPNEFKVTNEDIIEGSIAFDKKRSEKSEKLWENHSERSDIDWNLDRVFLFMKSQLCTKEGKMFTTAKAGQTLACFQHIVLFKFGPMLRAIERAFIRAVGESYYIHSGKNFFCLDQFIVRNRELFEGNSIESDYESFDSCQDHVILAFELELLTRMGVSHNWIKDYETMKMNLTCRLGDLAIMRFTGEFCTFLFNTFANMLFTFLKYKVDVRKDRILFAGDDMASIRLLEKRKEKGSIELKLLGLFSLKAIEGIREFPSFCGWFLTPFGILKSPRLLWARICTMKQKGLLESCVDNYLFEAIFAYRLSERLYSVLKEEDIEYHHLVTRFFIKNSKLLKGSSIQLLQEIGEGVGCHLSRSIPFCRQSRVKTLKLRQLNQERYTQMHLSSTQKYSKQSKGLKPMSRSILVGLTLLSFQTSNFLMSRKSNQYNQKGVNITTFTLGQFLVVSRPCFQTMNHLVARYAYMMDTACRLNMPTLPASSLISKQDRLTSYLGQDISSEQRTRIWQGGLELELTLTVQSMTLKLRYSLLTWESCIELQTPQGFSRMHMDLAGGLHKPFKVVRFLNSPKASRTLLRNQQEQCNSRILAQKLGDRAGVFSCQRGAQGAGITGLRKEIQSSLGQPHVVLKIRCLETMSLQEEVLLIRRRQIALFLWKEMIDKESKLLHKDLLVIPEGASFPRLEGDNETIFNHALYHYCKYFFGNIALFGSSPSVQFPDVSFWSPSIKVLMRQISQKGKEIDDGSSRMNETQIKWSLNLYLDVPKVLSHLHSLKYNAVKTITLRQMCEPFAKEAYDFLKEMNSRGVNTNIYKKWPRAFKNAPHVAFDFAHGLNMSLLSNEEKGVIDNMTRRLFKTEGQKGVFEAQGESKIELEG